MPKNLLLQTPSAGDVADLFTQAANDVPRFEMPSFPGTAAPSAARAPAPSGPIQTASQPAPAPATPGGRAAPTHADLIARAKALGIEEWLATSIFGVESSGNWNSKDSPKGAVGGMQVMPDTYKQMMGTYSGQRDPWNNMEAGLRYLQYGMKTLGTSDPSLLAAGYQAGYGNKDVRAGKLPTNVSDGNLTPAQYAAKVAKGGLTGDITEGGRYKQLTPEQAAQVEADAGEPGRFKALTPDELAKLPASALVDDAQKKDGEGWWKRNLGHLGTDAKVGWNNLLSSIDGIKQSESADMLDLFTKRYTQDQINADPKLQAEFAARAKAYADITKKIKDRGEENAKLNKEGGRASTNEFLGLSENAKWDMPTLKAIGSAVVKDPVGVIADLGVQSGPQMVAMMAAAVLARAAGTGVGGAALAGGATSGFLQFGSDYSDLREQGMSHDEAFKTAAAKASVVGALDGVSMGSAGHALDVVMAKSGGNKLLGIAKKAGTIAAETGKQGALGMTGEAGGSLASGRTPNPVDVAAEGLGEIAGAPFEAVSMKSGKPKAAPVVPPAATTATGPVTPAAPTPATPAPAAPTGPLGSAMAAAGLNPQPAPAAPAAPAGGKAVVVPGDDGSQYTVTSGPNGLTVTQIDPETGEITTAAPTPAAPAAPAAAAPAEEKKPAAEKAAPADEPLYQQAVDIVRAGDTGSISLVQRQLKIGYNRAARLLEQMEADGIVSAQTPDGKRTVLKGEKKQEAAAPAEKPAKVDVAGMSDADLTGRNDYLSEQAKANGGWNKVLTGERRRVQAEIDRRAKAATKEATNVQAATVGAGSVNPDAQADAATPAAQPGSKGAANPVPAVDSAAGKPNQALSQELAGAKPRYAFGSKQFDLSFDSDIDRAAYITAQKNPSKRDADFVKFVTDATGMTEEQVRAHGAAVRENIKGMARDAEPGMLKVPAVERGAAPAAPESAKSGTDLTDIADRWSRATTAERAAILGDAKLSDSLASRGFDKIEGPGQQRIAKAMRSRETTAPAAEATPDVAAGKWFGSQEKADAFVAKKGLSESHSVVQTGKVRFEIKPRAAAEIDAAAHEAQTSQNNDLPAPTQAQIEAGNYKKGHVNVQGLDITVENPQGSTRSGVAEDGTAWSSTMSDHYGYVRGTEGADGDQVDVYVGSNPDAERVYVIDQIDQKTGKFDEHKAMIGFDSQEAATAAYSKNFDAGWKVGEVADMSMADFKTWLKEGDTKAPAVDPDAPTFTDAYRLAVKDPEGKTLKGWQEIGENADGDKVYDTVGIRAVKTGDYVVKEVAHMPKGQRVAEFNTVSSTLDHNLSPEHGGITRRESIDQDIADGKTTLKEFKSKEGVKWWELSEKGSKAPASLLNNQEQADYAREQIAKLGVAQAKAAAPKKPVTVKKVGEGMTAIVIDPSAGAKPANDGAKPNGTDPFAGNTLFTSDKVAAARDRLKKKLGTLNSGFDPELVMDGMTIAGAYIESGVRSFSEYAVAMTADIGEAVTPYLLSFWEGARNFPGLNTEGMTSVAESKQAHDALIAKQPVSPTIESAPTPEGTQNERLAAQESPAGSDAGVRAESPSADEGTRATEPVSGRADGSDVAGDKRAGAGSDARARDAGKRDVRAEPAEANAGNQHGDEQRNGDSARAGNGNDQGAKSRVGNDYRIGPGSLKREGSWRATATRNVDAVELAIKLTAENRTPTPDEQAQLSKFTGWGASEIANGIFPDRYGRYKDSTWQALGERLKAALTPEQYDTAKRTTQYAHYTSEGIITGIYGAMQRMGFGGGKLLEPGMGVGSFKGLMPASMAASSHYTGIEMDPVTGMIAKLLYPQSNIINDDFTKTALPRDYFDAAIGNPPFGQITISNDPEYRKNSFLLHDYFFAKTLDRVKPGGMLVFVTSKGTMDKGSDRARSYLAERANLVGAVRLPQTAFKDNAGTEVVTDVLFLQKRGNGVEDNGVKWLDTAEVTTPQGPTKINEYFAAHPEQILGSNALTGSMYRMNEYTVVPEPGVNLDEAFVNAVARLPENIYKAGAKNPQAAKAQALQRDFNPLNKKEGGVYVDKDGALMQTDNGSGVALEARRGADGKEIALKPKEKEFLKSWAGLRDSLKQAQLDQLTNGDWEKSLAALNATYDAFVKKHGNILDFSTITRTDDEGNVTETKRFKNDPLLRLDVDGPLAYSLEHITPTGEIEKAPVLSVRVLEQPREPEIKTTNDALFVSMNNLGRLDLDDVARLGSMTRTEAIEALGTAIYEDPAKGWQTNDEYLSGNVVRKLKEVEAAAKTDKRFKRNVDALLAVQPKPLGPTDITVKLGQNWVPSKDVAKFATEALGEEISVSYNERTGQWAAEQNGSNMSAFNGPRMNAGMILENVLNNKQLKITFRDADGKTHVDAESTEKVNDIASKMRAAFSSWIWTDTARADRLVNHYNEHFNNIAPRQFDGSHLTLPGVSMRFDLRANQKRAIWRAIQQGDTYLAHAVGAGKTFEMIAIGMEERRLGLSNKPMYAVPNHMLAQFAREFLELYPAANIMVADEQNFHTHNRRKFVAQAALNNPDAIVITHSAFGRIGMSDEFASKFISDQIGEWQAALDETDKSDRITRKQIEKRIEQLERRLESRQSAEKKDRVMSFEELGVDRLLVDEIHEFRKLDFATNQGNIKGIDPNGSQRSLDLYMKKTYLDQKNPGRALVGASGTPVTNTMGELFTVQRLFQAKQLEEDGLHNFDAWSNQYGDIVAGFEQNAAGGYEIVSRFAKFQNVPELMRRVRSFMDILTSQQLSQYVERPNVKTGGREVKVTPSPFGYKEYQKSLESRINAIRARKGPPKKGDDIILKVISDGRFSAIDMRFVDPTSPSDPNSKLNQMLAGVAADYHAAADFEYSTNGKVDANKGASHIIFTDIGLGEQSAETRGFDMKAWMEHALVEAGVKREHIAFVRDYNTHAKKERLFAAMRNGEKRIMIGGKDMETGVNVQKRLYTEEHLDAPWFPASVEQREGRIIRQGNQNKEVGIRAWATKGSYDATMWGMNARKARFIEQALTGDDSVRSLEDVSEASAFDMAAALASGDERYMKLAGLKADVERLDRLAHAHHDEQNKLRRDKNYAESSIEHDQKISDELTEALTKAKPIRAGEFSGKVGNVTIEDRAEFGGAVFNRFKELAEKEADTSEQIGEIGGFPIMYHGITLKGSGEYNAAVTIDIPGDPNPIISLPLDPDLPIGGIATRAANQVNNLEGQRAQLAERIKINGNRLKGINGRLGAVFPEQAMLLDKVAELHNLQDELTKEKTAENAPAPSADAAAATVDIEGKEKFSAAAMEEKAGTATEQLDASLRDGQYGDFAGKLIDAGSVVLHDTALTLPTKNAPEGVQGVTMPDGSIHLVASNLTTTSAPAVLLHEAFHSGGKSLMKEAAWTGLLGRLEALMNQGRQSGGRAREFYDAARASVDAANTPADQRVEEFGAYVVEHFEQAPRVFLRWADDAAGEIKAWVLRKFGKQLGAVTPAQLRALAVAALRDGRVGTNGPQGGERFSTPAAGTPPANSLTPAAPNFFERMQARAQNNMNRVKKVQERIAELTGAPIEERADYYQAETNRPGRIAARKDDAEIQMFKPLMQALKKTGFKPDDLADLLHAEHAVERNDAIARINPDMPDGGSGMTNAEAHAILVKYANATELKAVAQKARDISKATLQLKLDYGLIDQETFDTIDKAYANYVPLKGDGEYGPKVKRAMGHSSRDEYILENIARDYDQAIASGEKNLARQFLLALVAENPDDDLWTIGVPPKGRYIAGRVYNVVDTGPLGGKTGKTVGSFTSQSQVNAFLEGLGAHARANYTVLDSNGDRVAEFVKPLQENEVMVYVDGQPVRIQIHDLPLAAQLRPLDNAQMHPILEGMRTMNRYFSKIYTGANPAFILRNAFRDFGTGSINMAGQYGATTMATAWKNYPTAFGALGKWAATGKAPSGKMGTYLTEYRMQGGKTGGSWMSDLEAQGDNLTAMFEDAYGVGGFLKDGMKGKAAVVAGRKIVSGLAHVFEIGNQAAENAMRLGLYATLRDKGETPGKAAAAAKNITVDFDRKGSTTSALGAIWLFFNPAIQGTSNAFKTILKGDHKYQGMAALGMLGALGFLAAAGGMDDDKDEWLGTAWGMRTKNFRMRIGGKTLQVPVSQEFAPIYSMGVGLAEMTRGVSPMKTSARMVSSFIDAYFPLNGVYDADSDNHKADIAAAVTPTIAKPFAELANNRNSFGNKIVPESEHAPDQPANLKKYRSSEGSVYDDIAQAMAKGGEFIGMKPYQDDITKVSPETLKHLWRSYAGGLGQFVADMIGIGKLAVTEPSAIETKDVPFAQDFVKDQTMGALRSRYYDVTAESKAAREELMLAKKARDPEAITEIATREGNGILIGTAKVADKTTKTLSTIREMEVAIQKDKTLSVGERRAKLKENEALQQQIIRNALDVIQR